MAGKSVVTVCISQPCFSVCCRSAAMAQPFWIVSGLACAADVVTAHESCLYPNPNTQTSLVNAGNAHRVAQGAITIFYHGRLLDNNPVSNSTQATRLA